LQVVLDERMFTLASRRSEFAVALVRPVPRQCAALAVLFDQLPRHTAYGPAFADDADPATTA